MQFYGISDNIGRRRRPRKFYLGGPFCKFWPISGGGTRPFGGGAPGTGAPPYCSIPVLLRSGADLEKISGGGKKFFFEKIFIAKIAFLGFPDTVKTGGVTYLGAMGG